MNKERKNNILQIISGLFIGVLILGSVLFATPKAKAAMITFDPAAVAGIIENVVKEYVTDFVAWMSSDMIIDILNGEVVNWANTSWSLPIAPCIPDPDYPDSCPTLSEASDSTFITNPKAFFDNISQQVSKNFIGLISARENDRGSEYGFISDSLVSRLQNDYNIQASLPTDRLIATIEKDKLERFINDAGDGTSFTRGGGWQTWIDMTSNPVNYPDGVIAIARAELGAMNESTVNQIQTELAQGGGFLTVRTCVDYNENSPRADGFGCAEYSEVTPGSMIADRVGEVFTGDYDRAEQVDELSEVLSTIVQTYISNIVSSGLSQIEGRIRCSIGQAAGENNCVTEDESRRAIREAVVQPCRDIQKMIEQLNSSRLPQAQKTPLITDLMEKMISIECQISP